MRDHRSLDDRYDLDKEIERLRTRWSVSRKTVERLPAYEDFMLGDLGVVAERVVVLAFQDGCWHVMSSGASVPIWFGRDANGSCLSELAPDCAGALEAIALEASRSCTPQSAQTHCAREGLVQRYRLLGLPLQNRWGPETVAVYVGLDGPQYSLVDAIFRSTDEGVIALAAVHGGSETEFDFQIVDLNSGAAELLGLSAEAIRWRKLGEGTHAFNTPELRQKLIRTMNSGARETFEVSILREGRRLSLSVGLTSIGQLICATLTDVSHLKRREESFRLLFDANPVPMMIFDVVDRAILKVNDAAVHQYGYAREELVGLRVDRLWPDSEQEDRSDVVDRCDKSEEIASSVTFVLADQRKIDVLLFGGKVLFEEADAYIVALVDITERKRSEAKIAFLAHHDVLTGLPNRARFNEELVRRLQSDASASSSVAMIAIDLDLFKEVNDTLGHSAGDKVLQVVADRLRSGTSEHEIVARLGGDEFALIVDSFADDDDLGRLCSLLLESLRRPFDIDGIEIVIGASLGIAVFPRDGRTAEDLSKKADVALYRAKAEGRAGYRFYDEALEHKVRARRTMEADLRRSLHARELQLHYQPLMDVRGSDVLGFEALLRWTRDGTFVPPSQFIPLAEESGLINSIGEWVVDEACSEAARWPEDLAVAVNLSPVQFRDRGLASTIIAAVGRSGLAPSRLELEITESVLLAETDANFNALKKLKAAGIRISLDDFGTGYSSLKYLRLFPFDKLKADRSFVQDAVDSADSRAILQTVASLGRSLRITTLAEGVETKRQLAIVRKAGFDAVQGYLFSPAASPEEIPNLLRKLRHSTRHGSQKVA